MRKTHIFLKFLFCFTILLLIYSFWQREPHIDDAWLGEHSYWMCEKGFVKSELMKGVTHQEERFLLHHKLLTLHGAVIIKAFGLSLYALKSVGIFYLALFLLLFYGYAVKQKKLFTAKESYFPLLLLLINPLLFKFSFVFRPEIMVMFFGFVSYLFLDNVLGNDLQKRSMLLCSIGGLFAGLAFFAHLNGVIFIVSGFILLLWNRKFKHSLLFSLGALIGVALYFYDFTSTHGFSFWYYQLTFTPSHEISEKIALPIWFFANIFGEHMRFFHSPVEIALFVLVISSVIIGFKFLNKNHKNLLRYTLLLILMLSFFAIHKTTKYMILYLPYLVLIISLTIKESFYNRLELPKYLRRMKFFSLKKLHYFLLFLVLAFMAISLVYNTIVVTNKYDIRLHDKMIDKYTGNSNKTYHILAPTIYYFNHSDNVDSMRSLKAFSQVLPNNESNIQSSFFNLAQKYQVDLIILPYSYKPRFGVQKFNTGDTIDGFEVLQDSNAFFVAKRIISSK